MELGFGLTVLSVKPAARQGRNRRDPGIFNGGGAWAWALTRVRMQAQTREETGSGSHLKRARVDGVENEPSAANCTCCCDRVKRAGWTVADLLTQPVGVHEMRTAAGEVRYHASFGARAGCQSLHLGCFSSIHAAACAWDAEARRRSWQLVNSPKTDGEMCVLEVLRARGVTAERIGFPHVDTDHEWRSRQLDALLHSAQAGGIESTWASAISLQQRDHWVAAGNLLCFSCNPHAFATRKARSASAGWLDVPAKLSAIEWWNDSSVNRLRAVRAVIERCADDAAPEGTGGGTRPTYQAGYAALLRREACFASGAAALSRRSLLPCLLLLAETASLAHQLLAQCPQLVVLRAQAHGY